jgi:phosphate-selective porin OprO/OprP
MMNNTGSYATNIFTLFIDTIYKHRSFSFMTAYANKKTEDALVKNSDGSFTGVKLQISHGLNLLKEYLLSKTIEASSRYTNISLAKDITGKGTENQDTRGLFKYILGHHLKVQTDLKLAITGFKTNQLLYRFQIDIHF